MAEKTETGRRTTQCVRRIRQRMSLIHLDGSNLSSGMYFYRLEGGFFSDAEFSAFALTGTQSAEKGYGPESDSDPFRLPRSWVYPQNQSRLPKIRTL